MDLILDACFCGCLQITDKQQPGTGQAPWPTQHTTAARVPVLTFATSRRPPQEAHSSRAGGVRLCLQVGNGQGVECAGRGGQNPGLRAPGARRFLGQVSSDGQPAVRPSHCSESSSKKIGRSQRKEGRWAGRVNSEYCSNQTREMLGTDTGRDEETRVCARGPMRGPCVARRGQAPHSDRTAPRAPGHRDSSCPKWLTKIHCVSPGIHAADLSHTFQRGLIISLFLGCLPFSQLHEQ